MRKTRDMLEKRKTKFQRPGRERTAQGELPGRATVTHRLWGHPGPPYAPTMNEGPVQPLDVVILGEGEQHLVADDGEGQEEDGTQCHSQGEGTELQPARGMSITSGWGFLWVSQPSSAPQRHQHPQDTVSWLRKRPRDKQVLTQSC